MRHGVKKIRFKGGRNASLKLVRKLATNFLHKGTITTTEKRIRVLRTQSEVLINKAKRNSSADRNFLLSRLGDKKLVAKVTDKIAPVFKDVTGGYVRIVKLGPREADGAKVARLEWTRPVVMEKEEKKEKKVKGEKKPSKTTKPKASKVVKTKKVNKTKKQK